MQTRERAHFARSVLPFIKKKKKKNFDPLALRCCILSLLCFNLLTWILNDTLTPAPLNTKPTHTEREKTGECPNDPSSYQW